MSQHTNKQSNQVSNRIALVPLTERIVLYASGTVVNYSSLVNKSSHRSKSMRSRSKSFLYSRIMSWHSALGEHVVML